MIVLRTGKELNDMVERTDYDTASYFLVGCDSFGYENLDTLIDLGWCGGKDEMRANVLSTIQALEEAIRRADL